MVVKEFVINGTSFNIRRTTKKRKKQMGKVLELTSQWISFLDEYVIIPDNSIETTQKLDVLLDTKGLCENYNPTYIVTVCEDILIYYN